jgi:magnesium chelatase family protein
MIDRFDLIIEVLEVSAKLLLSPEEGEATLSIAGRVAAAREFGQLQIKGNPDGIVAEEKPPSADDMSADARALLTLALDKQSLSARGFHKVIRVARTIANLQQIAQIDRPHLAEALAYRSMPLLA